MFCGHRSKSYKSSIMLIIENSIKKSKVTTFCTSNIMSLYLYSSNEVFSAYHIHVDLDSSFEVAAVKFRGWRYGVKSSPRSDKWAIVIKVGRPHSQVVFGVMRGGGINLCFSQLFSETEQQQILPAQSAAIRTAIPSSTARDQGCKHLRQGCCKEQAGRKKTQLFSCMQPFSLCRTGNCSSWYCSLTVTFHIIIFNHKSKTFCAHCQESSAQHFSYTSRKELLHTNENPDCSWWVRVCHA